MPDAVIATGHDVVGRTLRRKGTKAVHLQATMNAAATDAEREIRPTHRDRSGALTRSMYAGGDQLRDVYPDGFTLGSTVPYGRFVFRGTKRMAAQPPKVNARAIGRRTADRINAVLERA